MGTDPRSPPSCPAATTSHRSQPAPITLAVCSLMALQCVGVSDDAAHGPVLATCSGTGVAACAQGCFHVLLSVAAGATHVNCPSGWAVVSAGDNEFGQLGDGSTAGCGGTSSRWDPTVVSGRHKFTQISAGGQHTCGVRTDGIAMCWGECCCCLMFATCCSGADAYAAACA